MNRDIIKKKQIEKLISNNRLASSLGFSYEKILNPEQDEAIICEKLAIFFGIAEKVFQSNYKLNILKKYSNYILILLIVASLFFAFSSVRLGIITKLPIIFLICNILIIIMSIASIFIFRKNILAKGLLIITPMLFFSIYYLFYYWSQIG